MAREALLAQDSIQDGSLDEACPELLSVGVAVYPFA